MSKTRVVRSNMNSPSKKILTPIKKPSARLNVVAVSRPKIGHRSRLLAHLKNLELNRFKIIDNINSKALQLVGESPVKRIFHSTWSKYIPGLRWIAGIILLKSRNVSDNPEESLKKYFQTSRLRYIHYSLADWMLRHRDYSAITEHHFVKSQEKSREISSNFRYADFITQKYGYKSDKLKRVVARLSTSDVYRNLTKNQKMRLSVMLYHLDSAPKANKILKQLGKKFITSNTTSPYIFNKLAENKIFNDHYIERGSQSYKIILRARSEFVRMLLESKGNFCIVGNAPTERGTGNGAIIDSHALVIRINDYSLSYPDDYGSKQDIWVRVANKEITQDHSKESKMVIFAANNFAIKRRDAANYILPLQLMDKLYTVIPSHIYRRLIENLDGLPSTGLAIAYWAYTIAGKIPRESLFGFSHLHESADFKAHYYANQIVIGTHLHEWDKERIIFNQITEQAHAE